MRDASQVAEARRSAAEVGRAAGADEAKIARVMLVVTEMATNLLKHGGGGEIVIGQFADSDGAGIELIALDNGPGMSDVARCMRDGFSMSGSPGVGLGTMSRQADRFAIYSLPGKGTAVVVRFRTAADSLAGVRIGTASAPFGAETVSGDQWGFAFSRCAGPTLFVADGSGHGLEAARAARLAVDTFRAGADLDCVELGHRVHRALAPTRGAAIAIARFDMAEHVVRFVGIGNIGAAVASKGQLRRMASIDGIAGHMTPRIREFTYPYDDQPLLILHSDGLSGRWDLDAYPGLVMSDASLVAGVLFRDFRRTSDDALIVAARLAA